MANKQNEMTAEIKRPSLDKLQHLFFSQLRSLCKSVESGLEDLKREHSYTDASGPDNSVCARNMILHTAKELKELKVQAQEQYKDFAVQRARLSRIRELMQSLVQVYMQRLKTLESFIEKYGYIRPEPLHVENVEKDKLTKGRPNNGGEQGSDHKIYESGTDCGEVAKEDVKTPPSKFEESRARRKNLFLTPKLEDFCPGTSEARLALPDLRRSIKNSSLSLRDNQSEVEPPVQTMPESPASFATNQKGTTCTFTNHLIMEKSCSVRPELYDTMANPRKGPHLSTPETPEQVRTIIGSMKKSKADATSVRSVLFSTPETPEHLRTVQISSKKSIPKSTPVGRSLFSTPETPENIRTVIGSMKKSKPDILPTVRAHLTTPKTPEHVRTVISSIKKSKPNVTPTAALAPPNEIEQPNLFTNQNLSTNKLPTLSYVKSKLSTPETPENIRRILSSINGTVPVHERKFPEHPQELKTFEHSKPYCQFPVGRPAVKRNILSTPEPPRCFTQTLDSKKKA
ncbi:hypothetical protein RRG08_026541 [Elysia crispata]|uniref:Uncharacterized protein n=1 Tax=Elysia crispata TaxID=231223 RepID=A0AAE0Y4Z3_9GAST|nr:hypothetical protein RRG08_026541 [Elysia crispata]